MNSGEAELADWLFKWSDRRGLALEWPELTALGLVAPASLDQARRGLFTGIIARPISGESRRVLSPNFIPSNKAHHHSFRDF